jgi:hypothetical protein
MQIDINGILYDSITTSKLDLSNLQLSSLPDLDVFVNVILLKCDNNRLISLPKLPPNLDMIYCNDNQLTSLPELPQTLRKLICSNNQLTSLPELPPNLLEIYCFNNQLTSLPELPPYLLEIYCFNNQLTSLSALPHNLEMLYCNENQLTSLLELPPNLVELDCNNNQLTILPIRPRNLINFSFNHNINLIVPPDWGIAQPRVVPILGVAYEIHNSFSKINLEKYLQIINPLNHINTSCQNNAKQFIINSFTEFIDSNFKASIKQTSKDKLTAIITKLFNAIEISANPRNVNIMCSSVYFIMQQPTEVKEFYIKTFIQDCYHAYTGENGLSCVKGILERFVMLIGDAVFSVCPDEQCDNEQYKELLKIFGKKMDINELTQEWANLYLESPEIINMVNPDNTPNIEARKNHYIKFVKQKYQTAGMLDEITTQKIITEANKLEYAFKDLQFGGRRKYKKIKTRKLKKTRKTRKISKIRKIRKTKNLRKTKK